MNHSAPANHYLAHQVVSQEQLDTWVETFHREGFLFLENVLPPDWCAELRDDLDRTLRDNPNGANSTGGHVNLSHRMFEMSHANLRLFDLEPIVSFAETLIDNRCHVIHNNSFQSPPGGGLSGWHQDDNPHYLVTHGDPPTNVRLPVLCFTANYYLTDVTTVERGSTEVIPRSHLFGSEPPRQLEGTQWQPLIHPNLGPAGSVIMFNNQVWHRGGPNLSDRTRYITQITYARRLVGHKYHPFMNYQMPQHVYEDANPRLRRLLGFLDHGAYG
ncbi:MAG: mitomycin antibiotics/polyketide fumonisin biosynthesis protein [Planctomycetaceae bacterium]|nr:mitomycin antibiotics/polyketide fumonisin biosynthesis protein [Planctomycetaceae bacterium]